MAKTDKTEKPVCILRSLDGLTAVLPVAQISQSFVMKSLPLKNSSFPQHDHLLRAWDYLKAADLEDPRVFEAAAYILENSFPASPASLPLKNLEALCVLPSPPKPTAANPRAFKGTKRSLSKISQPQKIDLRPYLLNLQGTHQIIDLDQDLRQIYPAGKDPFLSAHFDVPKGINFFTQPENFRKYFLPQLKGKNWSQITDFLKLYFDLDLDSDKDFQQQTARVLYDYGAEFSLCLFKQLLLLEDELRESALNLVLSVASESASFRKATDKLEQAVPLAKRFSSCSHILNVLKYILSGIRWDCSIEVITFGLELYRDFKDYLPTNKKSQSDGAISTRNLFYVSTATGELPVTEIRDLLTYFIDTDNIYNEWNEKVEWHDGLLLLDIYAENQQNKNTFLEIPWQSLHPKIAHQLFKTWNFHPELSSFVFIVLDFLKIHGQDKIGRSLLYEVDNILDEDEKYHAVLPEFLPWFLSIAEMEGIHEAYLGPLLLYLFYNFNTSQRHRLTAISDTTIQIISKACKRQNDASLIDSSLNTICQHLPDFVMEALEKCPNSLLKVAKDFGCLNKTLREKVLTKLKIHPVFRIQLNGEKNAILDKIRTLVNNTNQLHISRKLKSSILSGEDIDDQLIDRIMLTVNAEICKIKLGILEELIYSEMVPGKQLTEMKSSLRHAFKLLHQNNNCYNSRAFKKFLRNYLNGDHNYLQNHPRTREWIKKMDGINLDKWINGFEKRYHLGQSKTPYTIKIELDPLEALKYGTLAGTCMGVGGGYSNSALATVLDENKKVIYAMNEKNHIIARQLIAISNDKKLVCFKIYPGDTRGKIKRLFESFYKSLADSMGIELVPADAKYAVDCIISSDWYDDGQYTPKPKQKRKN